MSLYLGLYPIGARGFGEIDPADDHSTVPATVILPEGAIVYAVTLQPAFRATGATATLRFSTHGYATGPADAALPSTAFLQAVRQPLDYTRRLSALSRGRRAAPAYGRIVLAGSGGDIDSLITDYAWDDRPVEVRAGGLGWPWDSFRTVMTGRAVACTGDAGTVVIEIADPSARLRKPLQANLYAGTGGLEGGDVLKGQPKPIALGLCRDIEPVPVNPAALVYQWNDGPSAGVDAVRVNGALWTYSATPGAGQYSVNLSNSTITLGGSAPPQGILTMDVRGDAAGTYVATASQILDRLLRARAGYGDEDLGGFSLSGGTIGVYFREAVTAEQAVDRIVEGVGGWYGWTREGRFGARTLGQLGSARGSLDVARVLDIACSAAPPPVWKVSVGWRPTWRVLNDNEVAGSVSAAERARLTSASSFAVASSAAIRVLSPNAAEMTVPGLFDNAADAQALADALLAWFGRPLREWQVPAMGAMHDFDVGDVATLTLPRFGLDAGEDFFVDEIREDAAAGRLTLTLVG